jgi:uncharacterized membrane protein YfcA
MAPFFTPTVLIPLHGIVQLASNVTRTLLLKPHIDKRIAFLFVIGSVVGTFFGTPFIHLLPENFFRFLLGCFILIMTWMPKPKKAPKHRYMFAGVGLGAGFLSLFIGATGPFIAPFFLHAGLDKKGLVASKAFCQAVLHTTKMVAYFVSGFVLTPWLEELAWMIPAVILGNMLGKKILFKLPEDQFRSILKLLITLAALRVIWLAFE